MKRMLEHEDNSLDEDFCTMAAPRGGGVWGSSPLPTWRLYPHFSPCQKKMWQKLSQKHLPNFWIFALLPPQPPKMHFSLDAPSSKKKKKFWSRHCFCRSSCAVYSTEGFFTKESCLLGAFTLKGSMGSRVHVFLKTPFFRQVFKTPENHPFKPLFSCMQRPYLWKKCIFKPNFLWFYFNFSSEA